MLGAEAKDGSRRETRFGRHPLLLGARGDHRTGHLIVRLPRERVQELVNGRVGEAFAPAGRTFKEWVLVSGRRKATWTSLMKEAKTFAEGR